MRTNLPLVKTPKRQDALAWGLFGALIVGGHLLARLMCATEAATDCPAWWPVSVFAWRLPSVLDVAVAGAAALVFVFTLRRVDGSLAAVIAAGAAIVLLTNLAQGFEDGYVRPIAGTLGGPPQYAADTEVIDDPLGFVRGFPDAQRGLGLHTRTHPPGAVLTVWALLRLPGGAAAGSVAIAFASVALFAFCAARLSASDGHDRRTANGLAFLLLLVPAVQIYGLATIDALVGSLLLGVLWAVVCVRRPWASALAGGSFLAAAASMSFAAVFVLPVVGGWELWRRRTILRSAAVTAVAALPFVGTRVLLGFDYLASFRTAAALENPRGFRLLASPGDYVLTRLEGIAEVALFAGPVLGVLAIRGAARWWRERPATFPVAWLAAGTFAAMILAGVYRTGETARASVYLYPYLLLAAGGELTRPERRRATAIALMSQTLLMQMFGDYFW